jgi:hypothetical protein
MCNGNIFSKMLLILSVAIFFSNQNYLAHFFFLHIFLKTTSPTLATFHKIGNFPPNFSPYMHLILMKDILFFQPSNNFFKSKLSSPFLVPAYFSQNNFPTLATFHKVGNFIPYFSPCMHLILIKDNLLFQNTYQNFSNFLYCYCETVSWI